MNKSLLTILGAFCFVTLVQYQGMSQSSREASTSDKKQLTRAQFMAFDESQQRQLMLDFHLVEITDLVNASADDVLSRNPNITYLSLEEYSGANAQKQIHILKNPGLYMVYDNKSMDTQQSKAGAGVLKSHTITKAEFNSLPEEKQKSIIESNQFTIIE